MIRRVLGPFLLAVALLLPSTARGQQPPAGAFRMPAAPVRPIRHHISFMLSGGFDLDVFGNVIEGALGQRGGAQVAVRQSVAWPDIYVAVPKRADFSVGFGVFKKDEVVARVSRAIYTSEPLTDAGNYAGGGLVGDLTIDVSQYRERAWEIGMRHYLVLTPKVKQYANFMWGVRTIEPISANLVVSEPTGSIGTFRLYDQSKVKTISLEIGLTFEFGRVGLFAQVGGRYVYRLKRNDDELAEWSLQALNNSGSRFYMPAQFGVLFRL